MSTEVYSWRVASELKMGLEREARRRKISMSAALDLATREWLQKSAAENETDEEQLRLKNAAAKWLGALAGGDPGRAANASQTVRQRLRRRYGR